MTLYFGFAIADAMFPETCTIKRRPIAPPEAAALLPGAVVCVNPSHQTTIDAAIKRFGFPLSIPPNAESVKLASGDRVLVMSVRGLPRREGGGDYTAAEIAQADFAFGLWTVL